MSNKNYERGVKFERERIEFHEGRKAKLVFRTAGSHSLIDVGAIYKAKKDYAISNILRGRIALEQCEVTTKKTRKKKLPFKSGMYWVDFTTLTKIVAVRRKRGKRPNKN